MVGAALAMSLAISVAMTAIECGRALHRITTLAQTAATTHIDAAGKKPAPPLPPRRWIVSSERATGSTLIVAVDAGAEAQGPNPSTKEPVRLSEQLQLGDG